MSYLLFYYFCRAMMLTAFGLAVADAASTVAALAYGGKEANPLWRWVMAISETFTGKKALWVIPRVLVALLVVWLSVGNATSAFSVWALIGVVLPNVVLGYVVWSNFKIAKALREKARSNLT